MDKVKPKIVIINILNHSKKKIANFNIKSKNINIATKKVNIAIIDINIYCTVYK